DGNASFDNALPAYWHDSTLEANVPFEMVASGPLGAGLKVSYYEGNKLLKVATVLDGPYHVMLDGLAPGIHSIHMVVEVEGGREISHPVLVTAVEKK
ncbi:MAG: hypothetical protein WCJ56_00820, partial [bacterium]